MQANAGSTKLTVLYGHPTDPDAFERYYTGTHMPLVQKIRGVRTEQAKVVGTPDGSTPTHYRIFEFWFDDAQHMQQVMGSPEAQAAVADVPNFASGGVSILVSRID
jgi:uncharacterized protein (TIGR02118 family)